ncbi:MAG: hypothetical protein ACLP9L_10495, partial [Thermoguttaceae bacterium]
AVADYIGYHDGPSNAMAKLKEALNAAPETPDAPLIKEALQRLEVRAKAETAAVKLKAKVEKASGPNRSKLLDQLLEAYAKVGNRIAGKDQSPDVNKWREEVANLDPETKAGPKESQEQ